ncbi:MAG: type II secretion system F family protein [Chloroflexi bacterium]|nr:type II secretion system F family protein [Chloroflexota bacterium]
MESGVAGYNTKPRVMDLKTGPKELIFRFKGRTAHGKSITGTIKAPNRELALKGLFEERIIVLCLDETDEKSRFSRPMFRIKLPWESNLRDVAVFTRQLSSMYRAGVPLFRAVGILHDQADNADLKSALSMVYLELMKGSTLAASLKDHGKLFSPQYVAMIWAAEKSGTLHTVLEDMADFLEKQDALRHRLQSAMTYPVMIFIASLLVNYFIFSYVMPQFVTIFNNLSIQLPLITRVLMDAVKIFSSPYFWILSVLVLILLFRTTYDLRRIASYRQAIDYYKMQIPVIGEIYRNYIFVNVFRLMSTMMASGMNLGEIMESMSGVSENAFMEKIFGRIGKALRSGKTITHSFLLEGSIFPSLVVSILNVGEESGETDYVLGTLADFYESKFDYAVTNIASLLEPVLIILMGISVAVLVLALFLPLYNMIGNLG